MAEIISYLIHLLIITGIYMLLAVSLNLILGYTGMLNLGHIALFGIGAYTSVLLNINGVNFILSFLAAGILAAFFGFILIFTTKKLQGDYYALATLGFAFVVYSLLLNLTAITRGPLGISAIPKPNLFGFVLKENLYYLVFVAIITSLSIFFINKLAKSKFGKLLEAMRDDEIRIRALGKNSSKLKYKSMLISAFFAGISGSMFAHYISFINPYSFFLDDLILVLTIVIVGGIASIKGTLLSTFFIILIPEILRFISIPSSFVGPARQIFYAIILLIILMYKPRGIFGRIDLE